MRNRLATEELSAYTADRGNNEKRGNPEVKDQIWVNGGQTECSHFVVLTSGQLGELTGASQETGHHEHKIHTTESSTESDAVSARKKKRNRG